MTEKDSRRFRRRRTTKEETIRKRRPAATKEWAGSEVEAEGVRPKAPTKTSSRAVATPNPREACLVMIHGPELGRRINIEEPGTVLIGRADESDLVLEEEEVSRQHCEVVAADGRYLVRDLESTNGTYVNDEVVVECELRDGDQIQIGSGIFKFISSTNIEIAYHEEIYRLSTTDGLTQAYNKRFLLDYLDRELSRSRRQRHEFSLVLLDIDHFKRVNDEFGHLVGDQVLKQIAALIRSNVRQEDILARFGGEEFVVVLPEVGRVGARQCAVKLHALVGAHRFESEGSPIPLTVSIGVVTSDPTTSTAAQLIAQADKQLYRAKQLGRNRACGPGDEA